MECEHSVSIIIDERKMSNISFCYCRVLLLSAKKHIIFSNAPPQNVTNRPIWEN